MAETKTLSQKIISFIKSRATIVTAIFGIFGAALQKLILKINDNLLGDFGFIFALLFAFITCMVFSLVLRGDYKNRKSEKFKVFKRRLNTGIIFSSIFLVCIGFFYFYLVNTRTVIYKPYGETTRLIKGEYKTELDIADMRKSILAADPGTKSITDASLIKEAGGTAEALYTPESLAQNRFLLLVVYCLFIIAFTAVSYIVPDIVSVFYSDIEDGKPLI